MKGLEVKGLDIIGKLKEKPESLNRRDDTRKVIKHAIPEGRVANVRRLFQHTKT